MNNNRIAIVTDSTCDLPDSLLEQYHIRFVPLRIVYKQQEYRDRVDITAQQVIERFAEEIPKTTLPLPQDVTDVLDGLAAEGYTDAIYLSISGGLSGSCNLVRLIAQQYERMRVEVVDTATVSMPLGFLVLEAAREVARSADVQAVVERIRKIRSSMDTLFVIRNLEYLVRGGRIGMVEGLMGNLLDIKPIITFGLDGVCHTVSKARGFKNAAQKMLASLQLKYTGKKIHAAVLHASAPEEAGALMESIRKFATVCESYIAHLCPALSIYSGPGLLGVVAYEEQEQVASS